MVTKDLLMVTEQEDSVAWIQTSDLATQWEIAALKEVSLEWKAKISRLYLFTWSARCNPELVPPLCHTLLYDLDQGASSQVSVPTPIKCWPMITQMPFSSVAIWVQCKWTEEIWEHTTTADIMSRGVHIKWELGECEQSESAPSVLWNAIYCTITAILIAFVSWKIYTT